MADFAAQVDSWVASSDRRLRAVFQESTQRVVSYMQTPSGGGGNMRIDTGFLRASIRASLSAMPGINPGAKPPPGTAPNSIQWDAANVTLTIANAQLGQTIYIGYTASYAPYVENRFGFVRLAAMTWQQTVRDVSAELRRRSGV